MIADQLNMKNAIADALQIGHHDDDDNDELIDEQDIEHRNAVIDEQQTRLLSNIFGAYFKNNFEFVLLRKLDSNSKSKATNTTNSNSSDDHKVDDGEGQNALNSKNSNLVDEVLEWTQSEWLQSIGTLGDDEKVAMKEYIRECLEVCWVMILQDPPLEIIPNQWRSKGLGTEWTVYDDKYHKRVLGSDRHCKGILYFVWPAVARKGVVLGDQKVDVLLREEMYTETKQKK